MARKPKSNDKPTPESAARPKGYSPRTRRAPAPPPAPPPEPPPDANGTVEPEPIAEPPEFRRGNCLAGTGRLASEVNESAPKWFHEPLVPAGVLSFVVGDPGTGKSTYGAWLCGQARRPVILPGNEEDVGCALLPRLRAARVKLGECLILDDRLWSLPSDRAPLARMLTAHGCDLLWIDPIDSYVGECKENDGQGVRAALEALARVAREVGCAVVAARHPGKLAGNLCPGSRQWRAVPREIVELRHDPGPPSRRILRLTRDPFSRGVLPRAFSLVGEPGEPKRLELDESVSVEVAETIGVGDSVDRWKTDEAEAMIRALLAEKEQTSVYLYAAAERERISDRTVFRAARRIGVLMRRQGKGSDHKCIWRLTTTATPAELDTDTP